MIQRWGHKGKGKKDEKTDKQSYKWSTLSDRAGWRECFLPRRNTQWQAGGRSLGKVTKSHTPSLAIWTNTRSLDQRRRCWCAVLNCSGAQSSPERCHCWKSAAFAFTTYSIWFCGSGQVQRVTDWRSVGKRCAWRDCSPLPELCLSALVSTWESNNIYLSIIWLKV